MGLINQISFGLFDSHHPLEYTIAVIKPFNIAKNINKQKPSYFMFLFASLSFAAFVH